MRSKGELTNPLESIREFGGTKERNFSTRVSFFFFFLRERWGTVRIVGIGGFRLNVEEPTASLGSKRVRRRIKNQISDEISIRLNFPFDPLSHFLGWGSVVRQ